MEAGEMAQQLQTSTSSPITSVQTPELITVERTDFHKLPTTSTGIWLHTHAFMYAHRIIVIIINKIRRKKEKFTNSNNPRSPPQTTGPFNVTNKDSTGSFISHFLCSAPNGEEDNLHFQLCNN